MASPSNEKSEKNEPRISTEPEDEYEDAERNFQPKSLKFWTILIGMYLAMFLVALVSAFTSLTGHQAYNLGPDYHRHASRSHHQRVQLHRRHWMVRQRVHADQRLLHPRLWPHLQALLDQMGLSHLHPHL